MSAQPACAQPMHQCVFCDAVNGRSEGRVRRADPTLPGPPFHLYRAAARQAATMPACPWGLPLRQPCAMSGIVTLVSATGAPASKGPARRTRAQQLLPTHW